MSIIKPDFFRASAGQAAIRPYSAATGAKP